MAMNLDALLRIKADVQGENNIRRLGHSMQGLQGQVKNTASRFEKLKGAVVGFGAAIASSAVVGGLIGIVKRSIDAGDELFNLQAKTGIAATALIGIGNAAKLTDVDINQVGTGLTKLSANLVKAAEGNEKLAAKFEALGVNIKNANGQIVPADKALRQIANRFADMPDGAQKAAAAIAIFGKSGAELIPLLNEGAASMEQFTYKVSDDFAARSDLFNDTLTILGIKAQGFGIELTNALLPALQSTLEVFSELFNTKQDWTVLFDVIKFGLRTVATAIYATIKLVDQYLKAWGAQFQAISKITTGDFAGAGQALYGGLSRALEQAGRDFQSIQKLSTDAPSPGTGRRTGGRSMALDTTDIDRRAAAEARRAAAERRRAAREQESLEDRRNALLKRGADLQRELREKIEDVNAAYQGIGATPVEKLLLQRAEAIKENKRQIDEYRRDLFELENDAAEVGGAVIQQMFTDLMNQLSNANFDAAQREFTQGLKDLLPSLEDYDVKIKDLQIQKRDLTEVEKLNAQVNLLQLDILAQANPALAEHIKLLRDRAAALDAATEKNKKDSESIGKGILDKLQAYYDSIKNLGSAIGEAVVSGLQGLEDKLTEFVTTGKASFADLARSIISDLTRIAIRAAIIKPIVQAMGNMFPGLFKFADGGIMTGNGPMPLRKYANGGIANSPQLALYGEGSRPEAYVPLPDGRRIPVAMQGGGATINVSVDAKGTSVQGNGGRSEQLGRVIAQAVQAELIKQRRPGGILATA